MGLYVHHVPGRLRIQTPRLKVHRSIAESACEAAVAITGVLDAQANSLTGSLIVNYDRRRLAPAVLWQALAERGLVNGPVPIVDDSAVTRIEIPDYSGAGAGGQLFQALARVFIGKLLERSVVALVAAII